MKHQEFSYADTEMKIFKRILKQSGVYLFGSVLNQLSGLLMIIVLMKYHSISSYGLYSYAVAIVAVFSFIADGGISQFVIKELSQCKTHADQANFYRNSQGVQLITSSVIIILITCTAIFVDKNGEFIFILLLGCGAALNGYLNNSFLYFVANQNLRLYFIKDLIMSAAKVLLTFIGVLYNLPITFYCAINLMIAGFLFLFISILRRNNQFQHLLEFRINLQLFLRFFKSSWPYSLLALFNILYNKTDVLMLKEISEIKQVAYYAGAAQFIYPFMFISSALMTTLYPILSKSAHTTDEFEKVRRLSTYILCIVGLILSVFLFFFSPIFYELVFNKKFDNSLPIFKILVWYLAIVFLYGSYSNPIMAKNGVMFLLNINFVMIIIKVAMNLVLIPLYGALGASISSILCELIICATMIAYYNMRILNRSYKDG